MAGSQRVWSKQDTASHLPGRRRCRFEPGHPYGPVDSTDQNADTQVEA